MKEVHHESVENQRGHAQGRGGTLVVSLLY